MFSIYPPFYYGPHSAILSWITLVIAILLHVFCVVDKSCKERSMWAYMYFAYHLSISIWIILALIIGYTWSNQQPAAWDEI
jgi:cytochrome b561